MFNAIKYSKLATLDRILEPEGDLPTVSESDPHNSEPWYTYDMKTGEITLCSNDSVQRWPLPSVSSNVVLDYSGNIYNQGQFNYNISDNIDPFTED